MFPCRYFRNFPFDFEKVQCRLSILRNSYIPCRYSRNVPVDIKIVPCRILRKGCLEFKSQGPQVCTCTGMTSLTNGPVNLLILFTHGWVHSQGGLGGQNKEGIVLTYKKKTDKECLCIKSEVLYHNNTL